MEVCPDEWFLYKARSLWYKSIAVVAKFVNADPRNIVFVTNATTGVNRNLHKWLFCPKSAAILWVHPKYQDVINPLVVSWDQDGDFHDKFFQQGTMDHTPCLVVDAALRFYQELGGMEAINGYNKPLLSWASLMLATEWKTEVLPLPESMRAPFMTCIRLPSEFQSFYGTSHSSEELLRKDIFQCYKVVTAIVCIQSSLWCRISANVYNTKDDYVRLANAVYKMKLDLISGSFKPAISVITDSLGPSPAQSLNALT
ncbi:hypothetical protein QZH41_020605 [Actinostola sp. cb2023]|nr:hypothetical protein QZH41_020605 [Actinostola sp. cb2023]